MQAAAGSRFIDHFLVKPGGITAEAEEKQNQAKTKTLDPKPQALNPEVHEIFLVIPWNRQATRSRCPRVPSSGRRLLGPGLPTV